jgi:hypothetical protein
MWEPDGLATVELEFDLARLEGGANEQHHAPSLIPEFEDQVANLGLGLGLFQPLVFEQ